MAKGSTVEKVVFHKAQKLGIILCWERGGYFDAKKLHHVAHGPRPAVPQTTNYDRTEARHHFIANKVPQTRVG